MQELSKSMSGFAGSGAGREMMLFLSVGGAPQFVIVISPHKQA